DRAAKINLVAALALFDGHWKPKRVATVNDYEVKLAKVRGEFVRHVHADTDELFLVVHGRLTIRMDAGDVTLEPGELYVVPRGVPGASRGRGGGGPPPRAGGSRSPIGGAGAGGGGEPRGRGGGFPPRGWAPWGRRGGPARGAPATGQ